MEIASLIYILVVKFVRLCKWGELQLIRLFIRPITWACKEIVETYTSVVFHFLEDDNGNELDEKASAEEEKRVVRKCGNYDSAIHLNIHNKKEFFARLLNAGPFGYAETYMNSIWDYCKSQDDIVEVTKRFAETGIYRLYYHPWNSFLEWLEFDAFNLQRQQKGNVIAEHYNLGNDLYEAMLDPYMQYSCGYWAKADNLNDAQIDKLELIAQKLDLKPGMRVLDVGCGWGMLCKYLAEKHGVHCVGITISEEQAEYARKKCRELNVEIRVQDYRHLNEQFDRIVSVGIVEHVGHHNYSEFFEVLHRSLKDDGIFLLHSIGQNNKYMPNTNGFYEKYIFPNGRLPRMIHFVKETDGKFVVEDWHNFGPDYAKTLNAWRAKFNSTWEKFENKYGARFYRMWIMYLCMCEGLFKARNVQLWQIVFSKGGLKTEYRAPR